MMDLDKLKNRYYPTNVKKKLIGEDDFSRFVEMRFNNMAEARRDWYHRTHRTWKLWDVFQPWLVEGEKFDRAVRFPTLRDAGKAIVDEIMKAPPEATLEPIGGVKRNRAQALEFKIRETNENIYEKLIQRDCIKDMIFFGVGYRRADYYKVKMMKEDDCIVNWDDIGTERLDPTNVFWDEQGRNIWDPKRRDMKRDCIIKYEFPYSTFIDIFQEKEGFNIENVEPFYVPLSGDQNYPTSRETQEEEKSASPVVYVYEYINQEIGMKGFVANKVTIKPLDWIENDHGRINIVAYQFEKRQDTFYPMSLAELIAPHIYAQDTIFNLELMGLKLDLMPATMIDSDMGYNRKLHKLTPRAVWSMNVPPGKSLRDSVWPFQRAQRDSNGFYNMNNFLESQLTVTSGHDRKSLYLNPNELATQTAAKRQAAEKSVNALVFANELEAEAQLTELMVSDIKQYLTEKQEHKTKDGKETKKYRKVRAEGYIVKQQSEGDAIFEPSKGENSLFDLTEDSVDVDVQVKVKNMRTKMLLQEAKVNKLLQFLPITTNIAQIDPKVMERLDSVGILEQLAEAMDMDMKRTIKNVDGSSLNVIQREHIAMMMGINVPVPSEESYEDSLEHKKQHEKLRYIFKDGKRTDKETNIWSNLKQFQKDKWDNHYKATLENLKNKVLPEQKNPQEDMLAQAAGMLQGGQGGAAQEGGGQEAPKRIPLPNQQIEKKNNIANAGKL